MFISISKINGGRYIFCAGDEPTDESGSWVMSNRDAAILGDIQPTFDSFGSAHSYALQLVEEHPSCILAKKAMFYAQADNKVMDKELAEAAIVSHYLEQVENIGQRIAILNRTEIKDFDIEIDILSNEVAAIKSEVTNIIPIADEQGGKTFQAILNRINEFSERIEKLKNKHEVKTASKNSFLPNRLRRSAIRAFSEAAMLALQPTHKEVFVKKAYFFPENESYESILSTPDGNLVRLSFDKNLLLSGITACEQVRKACNGTHSNSFFLKYWEPIINAVGHFNSKGNSIVAVAGMDMSRRDRMKAFSTTDLSDSMLQISRPVIMGHKTWLLKKTAVTVTKTPNEGIIIDNEVECVSRKLPTYFGRTGAVDQIDERSGSLFYRVDFRRGIGIVWLEDKDVKKVELGVQS
jgi:hypothetical protein